MLNDYTRLFGKAIFKLLQHLLVVCFHHVTVFAKYVILKRHVVVKELCHSELCHLMYRTGFDGFDAENLKIKVLFVSYYVSPFWLTKMTVKVHVLD